jgi:Ca2+-binding RTX toxin-like protein
LDTVADAPYGLDYMIYSPDVACNGEEYLGGWLTAADIGPDQLYQSPGASTDAPVPIVWTNGDPYDTWHLNDPSVVRETNGTLAMFVTALSNVYGYDAAGMSSHNLVGLATSTDNGASWTWDGIVIGQFNGIDNTGAWSPSAMTAGTDIDLWYHTSTTDVATGLPASAGVMRSVMDSTGTTLLSTEQCINTATGQPLYAANVDVAQAADGTYWMVANDYASASNLYQLVAYESTDGINWTPWSTGGATLLSAGPTGMLLTPTILRVGNGNLDIMYSEKIGNNTVEHTADFSLSDGPSADVFLVANVFNGVQGVMTPEQGQTYDGPVSYLDNQFIYLGNDNLNIVAATPNVFLRGGNGDDALVALAGNNVLDGGMGSNFLTAGTGHDVFFSEAGGGADTWSTIAGFKPGDELTIWDITPNVRGVVWQDNMGAAGYKGATETVLDEQGHASSVTLAGWSAASARALSVDFGTSGGHTYMHIS